MRGEEIQNFLSPYPTDATYIPNLVKIGPIVFEKMLMDDDEHQPIAIARSPE